MGFSLLLDKLSNISLLGIHRADGMMGAQADPPPGAIDVEEPVSLLLFSFEPLFLHWIARLNLKTIPDYTTVTTLICLLAHEEQYTTNTQTLIPLSFSSNTFSNHHNIATTKHTLIMYPLSLLTHFVQQQLVTQWHMVNYVKGMLPDVSLSCIQCLRLPH
jgi:hypothetical protein